MAVIHTVESLGLRIVSRDGLGRPVSDLESEGRAAFPRGTVTVGIGRAVDGPEGLADSYYQAQRALLLGARLRGPSGVYALEDLGPLGLLLRAGCPEEPHQAALRPMQALREADAAGAPELGRTLHAYLDVDGDRMRAAARLNVHPNAVGYRLRCIEAVTGLAPERLADLLQLQLAALLEAAQGLVAFNATK